MKRRSTKTNLTDSVNSLRSVNSQRIPPNPAYQHLTLNQYVEFLKNCKLSFEAKILLRQLGVDVKIPRRQLLSLRSFQLYHNISRGTHVMKALFGTALGTIPVAEAVALRFFRHYCSDNHTFMEDLKYLDSVKAYECYFKIMGKDEFEFPEDIAPSLRAVWIHSNRVYLTGRLPSNLKYLILLWKMWCKYCILA
uniref:Transcription termination factor 3, mitochondrial n=1 Tax=Strongyloides papillosus TaxID=174720 RepID=A0A0N5B2Y3_STREA